MSFLEIIDVVQRYDDHTIVDGVGFNVDRGAIACLLGPSGCGKTTLLRCIAGFEGIASGEIRLDGVTITQKNWGLPPEDRQIGMVFQDYALFPHLTVADNVGFGLHRFTRQERERRVGELLETVGLTGQGRRYPHELSGGQQQRIALARAMAPRPRLILLDEPFSNLDTDLRERLSLEVRGILKQQNATAILVTHDQHEAFVMADEIGVMARGKIQQWDTAHNLYHQPANRMVAGFIGQGAFITGQRVDACNVMTELGQLTSRHPLAGKVDDLVDVLLRPDDLIHDEQGPSRATVINRAFRGAESLITLRLDSGTDVLALLPSHDDHMIGDRIGLRLDAPHVIVFPQQ